MAGRGPGYTRGRLESTAAESTGPVDMLRRLGQPLESGPLRYLRRRLAHYAVDTGHFVEQELPARPRRSYPRELLAEAAARAHSPGELMRYLGVVPYDSAYRHLSSRLAHFGIDTSHFGGPGDEAGLRRAVEGSESIAGTVRALGLPPSNSARAKVKEGIETFGHPDGSLRRTGASS